MALNSKVSVFILIFVFSEVQVAPSTVATFLCIQSFSFSSAIFTDNLSSKKPAFKKSNYRNRDCPTNGIVAFYSAILRSKDSDRITNRVDTDQTAPLGAV